MSIVYEDDIMSPLEDSTRSVEVPIPFKIQRNPEDYTLDTVKMFKKDRLVYDKRVVNCESFKTLPYGDRKSVV